MRFIGETSGRYAMRTACIAKRNKERKNLVTLGNGIFSAC
jgi:hypothetical protein